MVWILYIIIIIYFALGFAGFLYINRKKDAAEAKRSWIKFFTYFIIINVIFFAITLHPAIFKWVASLIVLMGAYELWSLYQGSGYQKSRIFAGSLLLYALLSLCFFRFSLLDSKTILFAFLIISISDSFSQITGQIIGKRKLIPRVSPNKTREGLLGGAIIAAASAILIKSLVMESSAGFWILTCGIIISANVGDLLASWYKRRYGVKDFSRMIPGHGGFLDRFDSLLAGGAWVAVFEALKEMT